MGQYTENLVKSFEELDSDPARLKQTLKQTLKTSTVRSPFSVSTLHNIFFLVKIFFPFIFAIHATCRARPPNGRRACSLWDAAKSEEEGCGSEKKLLLIPRTILEPHLFLSTLPLVIVTSYMINVTWSIHRIYCCTVIAGIESLRYTPKSLTYDGAGDRFWMPGHRWRRSSNICGKVGRASGSAFQQRFASQRTKCHTHTHTHTHGTVPRRIHQTERTSREPVADLHHQDEGFGKSWRYVLDRGSASTFHKLEYLRQE